MMVRNWKGRADSLGKASRILRGIVQNELSVGGGLFWVQETENALDALVMRFCPFKEGDRVVLTETPVITETKCSGWMGAKHFLIKGAAGVITEIGVQPSTGKFLASVDFDNQTRIDSEGKEHFSEHHEFVLTEDELGLEKKSG